MKLKLKICAEVLAAIKKCLISVIIRLSRNILIIQANSLLEKWKMKPIEEFGELYPEMYSLLVDKGEHKKAKSVNKNCCHNKS